MKKIKLLLTALVFILIIALCIGCENEITDTYAYIGGGSGTGSGSGENPVIANGKYELNVRNDSTQLGNFSIYQIYPEQTRPNNLYSVVWQSKTVHPNNKASFNWETSYSLVWIETGQLKLGDNIANPLSLQIKDVDINDPSHNLQYLSKNGDAFSFKDAAELGQKGKLTIKADGTIPNNKASIGVGMSGKPAILMNASANMTYQFTPTPTYWILFGDFKEGEVLDLNTINPTVRYVYSKVEKIVFPLNIYKRSLVFKEDNTWQWE